MRLSIVLTMVLISSEAQAALKGAAYHDTTHGWISCNGVNTTIASAIAIRSGDKLTLLLFKSVMNNERLSFWKASYPTSTIPTHLNSFAKLELTFAKGTTNVESYFFYIDCPTTQVNLNRSAAFDPGRMKREIPALATKDGRLSMRTKADKPQTLMSATVDWAIDVDSTLFSSP